MRHVLRCVACDREHERPVDQPRGHFECQCGARLLNLGPLPEPLHDLPMFSAVVPLAVPDLPDVTIEQVPKWVCSWCGRNVGVSSAPCRRCGCDLKITPPCSLPARVADEPSVVLSSLALQATHPIGHEVALCRLRRLDPKFVPSIHGTPELAAKMRAEERPPGAMAPSSTPYPFKPWTTPRRSGCILLFAIVCVLVVVASGWDGEGESSLSPIAEYSPATSSIPADIGDTVYASFRHSED